MRCWNWRRWGESASQSFGGNGKKIWRTADRPVQSELVGGYGSQGGSENGKMLISGVASDKKTSRVSVIGVQDKPEWRFKIFNTLAKKGSMWILSCSRWDAYTKDISFTVSQEDLNDTLKTLEEKQRVADDPGDQT